MSEEIYESDFLVIGTGIAGLMFSLKVAQLGSVSVLTKRKMYECATSRAQGGIAAVVSDEDSIASHVEDTLRVGSGLCHSDVVEKIVRRGPEAISELASLEVDFCRDESCGEYELGLEGGHSHRRVLHVKDHTGADIMRALTDAVRKADNIIVFEDHMAVNLVQRSNSVIGAYVLDTKERIVKRFAARATVLATGGAGKVFLYTSNPEHATGDGIAMAYRAGATITNMEFIQFHPTLLYDPTGTSRSFLISEALRGEGAVLLGPDGERFMPSYHPDAELAPRDIVARAIDQEMKRTGADFVHLDISFKDADFIRNRFPMIYETCLKAGIDITVDPIPVVPAVHYMCGGVKADEAGRTDVDRLFVIGESAGTGFHGANRLASNSLLEGAAMAHYAAEAVQSYSGRPIQAEEIPPWDPGEATDPDEMIVVTHTWDEIRRLMMNYVGIVRSRKRLIRARNRIDLLSKEINQFYWDFKITPDLVELRNIATVAELIIRMARMRKESRGTHYNLDYPEESGAPVDTILRKGYLPISATE
ncbi:L-aspartate oxidase [Candidatus Thorarchaeota archaeon]|nr:MAG: L-aspartate oxidase [Candidatus Thorarchaeota archaeon]